MVPLQPLLRSHFRSTCASLHIQRMLSQTRAHLITSSRLTFLLDEHYAQFCHNEHNTHNRCGAETAPSFTVCLSVTRTLRHTRIPAREQQTASILLLTLLSHLQCTCACPTLQSSKAIHQVQQILITFLPLLAPSASTTHTPFLSHSLSLWLSSSTCSGNSLFNSLQHQPINSFADGWLAHAGAG